MDVGITGAATASGSSENEVEKIPIPENKEFLDLQETEREIVAGDKAGVVHPEVIVKDGKKMRLVSEKTILGLMSNPLPRMTAYSAEFMREMGLNDEDIATVLRGIQASHDVKDFEDDVIEQYKANGCAYREILHEDFASMLTEEELLVQGIVQALENS